jgi:hypothetical protein
MNHKQLTEDITRILIAGIQPLPDAISQMEQARQRGDCREAVSLASRQWNAASKSFAIDMEFWRGIWEFYHGVMFVATAPLPVKGLEREFEIQAEASIGHFATSAQAFARADCTHGRIAAYLAQGRVNHLVNHRIEAQHLYEEGQRLCVEAGRRQAHRRTCDRCGIYPDLEWRIRGWMLQLHKPDLPRLIREIEPDPVGPTYTLSEDNICLTQQVAIDDQEYQLDNHQNRRGQSRTSLLPMAHYFLIDAQDDSMAATAQEAPQIDIHRGDRLLVQRTNGAQPQENGVDVFRLPNGRLVLRRAREGGGLILLEPVNPRYDLHILPDWTPRFSHLGSVVAILEKASSPSEGGKQ